MVDKGSYATDSLEELNNLQIRAKFFESKSRKGFMTERDVEREMEELRLSCLENAASLYDYTGDEFSGQVAEKFRKPMSFNPKEVALVLKDIVCDISELYARAFKLMLENMKPKHKDVEKESGLSDAEKTIGNSAQMSEVENVKENAPEKHQEMQKESFIRDRKKDNNMFYFHNSFVFQLLLTILFYYSTSSSKDIEALALINALNFISIASVVWKYILEFSSCPSNDRASITFLVFSISLMFSPLVLNMIVSLVAFVTLPSMSTSADGILNVFDSVIIWSFSSK